VNRIFLGKPGENGDDISDLLWDILTVRFLSKMVNMVPVPLSSAPALLGLSRLLDNLL
jgi:hypothetical protein